MTKNKNSKLDAGELRRRAQERLSERDDGAREAGAALDAQRLVHELEVHQIELEMQNEELTRTQAELEATLSRYSGLYDFAPVGYLTLDRSGVIQQANLTVARLLGLDRAQLVGTRLGLRVAAQDRPTLEALVANAFENPRKASIEVVTQPRSAEPRALELTAAGSDDGQECLVAITDVTERERAREKLRQSEERSRALFDFAPDPLFVTGHDRKFTEVNRAAVQAYGYSRDEFLAMGVEDIAALEISASVGERIAESLAQKAPFDWRHRRKDGSEIDVEIRIAPFNFGDQAHLLASARDVTERKRAAMERQKLEEQLRASQKIEAIGSLAGGIAHDFNNLLTVILSYTAFATDGVAEDDPVRDDLLEVKTSAERAAALTHQLLAFSRKQVLQPVLLDLNQVAAGLEPMLRRIVGEDILFLQRLAPDLGEVLADPDQLSQVLMNLVVNARDSMPEGGNVTIETHNVEFDEAYLACHPTARPGPHVQLAVTDTGCGMDEQIKARLFEPFFTTKETGKGTGLGLSMVHGIVTQSGGDIWVYSEPGQGTCIKISLPRQASASAAEVTEHLTDATRPSGTETILLVEDEAALRRVVARTLVAAGYTVLLAADGEAALQISAQTEGPIRLLMTDVVMPRMGGRTLARELLKLRRDVQVLYMSGYTNDAIVHHGVLDAGIHFIGKPFTATDLVTKVRAVLDEGVLRDATRSAAVIEPVSVAERPAPQLDWDGLRALPREVIGQLRKAVIAARYDEMVGLIEAIGETRPELATALRQMADSFDHGGLLALLDDRRGSRDDR